MEIILFLVIALIPLAMVAAGLSLIVGAIESIKKTLGR